MTIMTTSALKEQYGKLSETNRNVLSLMAEELIALGQNRDIKFKVGAFIDGISNETGITIPTAQRLYYTYIAKIKNNSNELAEIVKLKNESVSQSEEEVCSKIKVMNSEKKLWLFKDKYLEIHQSSDKYYFILDELLDVLPVSKTNKALKNGLVMKGRRTILINKVPVICVEIEKVLTFLQSFVKQFAEGHQKNEFRMFIENLHQLSTKNENGFITFNGDVKGLVPPVSSITAKPIDVGVKKNTDGKAENDTSQVESKLGNKYKVIPVSKHVHNNHQTKSTEPNGFKNNHKPLQQNNIERVTIKDSQSLIQKNNKEIQKQTESHSKGLNQSTSNKNLQRQGGLDESAELKTLTTLLNKKIGYLSPAAKEQLFKMTTDNGLVNTTVATLNIINGIDDIGLYFINKIAEELKVCL